MIDKTAPFRDSVLAKRRLELLQSRTLTEAAIRENFGNANLEMRTTQRLLQLQQTRSVHEYAVIFEQLCYEID
jgi:hypothetical protein